MRTQIPLPNLPPAKRSALEGAAVSAAEALRAAHVAGVTVMFDGDDLTLEASAAPLPALLDLLLRHKAGVMALLGPTKDEISD